MSERAWELILAAIIAGVLVFWCSHSQAKDVAEAQGEYGFVVLTDETGMCKAGAKAARWVPNGGGEHVPGCWRMVEGMVRVAFLDADSLTAPTAAFRVPETL